MTCSQPTFLGLEGVYADPSSARYAVLPVPYEGTVSYKGGTSAGPAAIIDASQQVELFDEELGGEFFQAGVATCPAVEAAGEPAQQMARVAAAAGPIMAAGKFLLALGGEHSITVPLVQAAAEAHGPISVLQIDAHADLRDSYSQTRLAHACVMRRVLETTGSICQVGIRSYCREEYEACPEQVRRFITPEMIAAESDWIGRALDLLTDTVYVTVDVDGLDPSLAPGVGTPEPGGLTWRQITALLRRVCSQRRVVAADVVEVRPIPPNHVTEFVAARLAYKLIAYTQLPGAVR